MTAARWALALALAACNAKEPPSDPVARSVPAADDHDSAGHGGDAGARVERVRIAADMMRDLRVTTTRAQTRTAGETVSALAELHVNEDAYAEVASSVTARVTKILARPGDEVTAGQTLVTLYSPALSESRAEIVAARSRADLAREAAQRKRALASERLVPEREALEAEAAHKAAEADYGVAASAMRRYGTPAGDVLAIRSPIAGTVIDRTVVMGELADPAKTLFRVGDLRTLWLVAHVFERDAVRVHPDHPAVATFAALPGRTVEAMIRQVGREVDPASRTIAIRLDVANPDRTLRPGMSATVAIPLGEVGASPVVVVPAAAVQRVGASWAVFLPRGAGAFEVRPIGRGRDLSGDVEVLSGLHPDDEVVVEGAFLLKAEADKARGGAEHED